MKKFISDFKIVWRCIISCVLGVALVCLVMCTLPIDMLDVMSAMQSNFMYILLFNVACTISSIMTYYMTFE